MRTPLDIAYRIWMTAVLVFTLLIAITILVISINDFWAFLGFLLMAAFISLISSFPVFAVLIVVLKKCQSSGLPGGWNLCIVYAVGITCAMIVYHVFVWMFTYAELRNSMLFGFVIASGVAGITTQARSIIKISAVEPE
jgi:hypothetical protein